MINYELRITKEIAGAPQPASRACSLKPEADNNMEITCYTTATIVQFTSSDQFPKLRHIPITSLRALSHSLNPRADAEDKILFVAWEKDEVAGYLGVLADKILQSGTMVKCAWLSCFWVDPAIRGSGIAKELFLRVMVAWENRILITNMAPGTMNFYLRSGLFGQPQFKEGIRCFLRFNLAEILPPKKKLFERVKPFLSAMDKMANMLNEIRVSSIPEKRYISTLKVEQVNGLDHDVHQFIMSLNQEEHMRRGKSELEWILANKWLIQSASPTEESKRYYFSLVAQRFFYRCLKFYNRKDELAGFMILSVRNNHLTIPYFFGTGEIHDEVVRYIVRTMLELKLNMVTVFHPALSREIRNAGTPFLQKRAIRRPYLASTEINISGLNFQDGDGDSVFT